MTTHQLNGKKLLIVDVPEGSSPFVDNVFGWLRFRVYVNFVEVPHPADIRLPEGKYSLLLTEEDAKGVVETDVFYDIDDADLVGDEYEGDECFKNYLPSSLKCWSAIESLHSWIRSKGKDPKLVVVLVKNE